LNHAVFRRLRLGERSERYRRDHERLAAFVADLVILVHWPSDVSELLFDRFFRRTFEMFGI
jgi:hypothetical protein